MEIREGEPGGNEPNQKPKRTKRFVGGRRDRNASRTTLDAVANDVPLFVSASEFWKQVLAEYRRLRKKRPDLGELEYLSKNQVKKAEAVRLDKIRRDTWVRRRLWELSIGMAMFEDSMSRKRITSATMKRNRSIGKWKEFLEGIHEESKIRKAPEDLSYTRKQLESLEKKLKFQAIENVKHRLAEKWRIEHGLDESPERGISHPVCGPGREEAEGLNQNTQPSGSPEGSESSEH